ncbi:hypothetical protein [Lactobacillus amylovorus]|uniref:hypothetical protein n=1 Tax=Lactobacillus amylovorus TaxID=1604 RepID=UPI00232D3A70|nr:hypothetical protein [Lactobacillus amylovorus]MDB6269075.1 hypothetical protein [Lactobacillus amylovorus]
MIEIITMILSWVIVVLQLMINHSITKYRKQVSDLKQENAHIMGDLLILEMHVGKLLRKQQIGSEKKDKGNE